MFVSSVCRAQGVDTAYSSHQKMERPSFIVKVGKTFYGSHYNEIYASSDTVVWYLEKEMNMDLICGVNAVNESTLVMWDCLKNINISYNTKTHKTAPFTYYHPIEKFLQHKIKKIIFVYTGSGCFGYPEETINYRVNEMGYLKLDTTFSISGYEYCFPKEDINDSFSESIVHDALQKLNNSPFVSPTKKDLLITEKDKIEYLKFIHDSDNNHILPTSQYQIADFEKIAKIPEKELYDISRYVSTHGEMQSLHHDDLLKFYFITDSDTLTFTNKFYGIPTAWNLPMLASYHHMHFNCYNIPFAKFLMSLYPKDLRSHDEPSQQTLLLWYCSQYLLNKKTGN